MSATLLLTFACCLTPQVPGGIAAQLRPLFDGPVHALKWPDDWVTTGPFQAAAALDLDGDGTRDVALLRGDRATYQPSPDHLGAQLSLPGSYHDLAALRAPDGREELFLVGSAGLVRARLEVPLEGFRLEIVAPLWQDVGRLAAEVEAGTGRRRFSGLTGAGLLRIGSLATDGTWSESTILLPAQFTSVSTAAWVDLDGDGVLELALHHPAGLVVIDENGQQLLSLPASAAHGLLARDPRGGGDRLVWLVRRASDLAEELRVVAAGGILSTSLLPPLDVRGIAVGDLDLDGRSDVVLAPGISRSLLVLYDRGSTSAPAFALGPQTSEAVTTGGPGARSPGAAPVLVADLEGDGDLDLFGVDEDDGTSLVARSGLRPRAYTTPVLTRALWNPHPHQPSSARLFFELPAAQVGPATRLEFKLYAQAALGLPVEAIPVRSGRVDPGGANSLLVEVDVPEATKLFDSIYHLTATLVEVDESGHVVSRGPSEVRAFAMDGRNIDALLDEQWGVAVWITSPGDDPLNPGGFVPRPRVQPFKRGDLPR